MKNSTQSSMNQLVQRKIDSRRQEAERLFAASWKQIDAGWKQLETKCKQRSAAAENTIISDMDQAFDRIQSRNRSLERRWLSSLFLGGVLMFLGAGAMFLFLDRFDPRMQTGKWMLNHGFTAGENEDSVWIWLPAGSEVRGHQTGRKFVLARK